MQPGNESLNSVTIISASTNKIDRNHEMERDLHTKQTIVLNYFEPSAYLELWKVLDQPPLLLPMVTFKVIFFL